MENKKLSNKIYIYILLGIIIIAVFFRFYNFPLRYGLGDETVRDAVMGIEGARQLQFPLVGAFSSAGPFTFGPWFYYQLIIFNLLTQSAYASWIYLSLASTFCVVILYKIGELVEDKTFGLILGLLAALSPALIIAATHLTTQNLTNIYALLAIWIFLKLVLQKLSNWWGFIFGIILGIGVNLHYQMVGLLILPIVLLIYKPKQFSYFITSLVGISVTYLPLMFFDMNNHWFTVRNILYYLQHGKDVIYVPNRWLFYLRDFWPSYWADVLGVPQIIAEIIMLLFIFLVIHKYLKRRLPMYIFLLLIAFAFNFFLLRYYWGPRFFGYLNFLRPFVFLFTGYTFLTMYKIRYGKYVFFPTMLFLLVFILPRSVERLSPDPFTLEMQKSVEILESSYPNSTFKIYKCQNINSNALGYSVVFLLDKKDKLTDSGMSIGIKSSDCQYPDIAQATKSGETVDMLYPTISNTALVDFSSLSEKSIKNANWQKVNFKSIFTEVARWWFKEQP